MRGKAKQLKKKSATMRKSSKKITKKRVKILRKLLRSKAKVRAQKKTSKPRVKPRKVKTKPKSGKKIVKSPKKITKAKTKKVVRKKRSFLEDKQLANYLEELVGEEGMTVVHQIAQRERSDVDLAEKMDLKANIIRKYLYAMYEAGVVTYRRHRSKTGWYTYYWKLHPERITKAISQEKEQQLKELMEMLEYEKNNHFYQCKSKCTRVIFDEATDLGFRCMKCNKPLEHANNNRFIKDLEGRIIKIKTVQEIPE